MAILTSYRGRAQDIALPALSDLSDRMRTVELFGELFFYKETLIEVLDSQLNREEPG